MKKPKVSIIMATYNQEKYVAKSIESVLAQTLKDFELLIINDKSTDKTLSIIKSYMIKDKRIKLLNNKKNIGCTKSFNVGLKAAQGKYIAILDPDDMSMPERLLTEYTYLENHKQVFLIGGAVYFIDENDHIKGTDHPTTGFDEIKEVLKERNCFWHCTVMFRNDKKTRYREKFRYSQDFELYTRMVTEGKIIDNLPVILSKYRVHQNSVSYSKRTIQDLFVKKIRELYAQRLKTGKDNYESFNPDSIINFDVEKTRDKKLLHNEVNASWNTNNFSRARKFARRYIKYNGIFNKIAIYYLMSFLNPKLIFLIRKMKNTYKIK